MRGTEYIHRFLIFQFDTDFGKILLQVTHQERLFPFPDDDQLKASPAIAFQHGRH